MRMDASQPNRNMFNILDFMPDAQLQKTKEKSKEAKLRGGEPASDADDLALSDDELFAMREKQKPSKEEIEAAKAEAKR